MWLSGKEPACQCRRHKRHGFDPWVRKIPGEGNGNPLQYSCLENSMEPGGLQCMGLQRVSTLMTEHTFYSTDEEIESWREYK